MAAAMAVAATAAGTEVVATRVVTVWMVVVWMAGRVAARVVVREQRWVNRRTKGMPAAEGLVAAVAARVHGHN